ncbi:uncharacterized protein LOC127280532 [Leptopilina boulardi]|uniref:uncharacterized protein LOC127280532 n=1 Tax=Leptopilina boulardi TaxID=63433 RepID=UPI0021F522E0|nr:uncharacterized protein LOC127280532 [Leptopilina boulardi]
MLNEKNSSTIIMEKKILHKNEKITTYLEKNEKILSPKTFRMKKSPKKSLIPKAIKSMKLQDEKLLINNELNLIMRENSENFEWRNLELNEGKNSPTRNLIESIDSGIHTDFSLTEQRIEKNSYRSTNDDSLRLRGKNDNLFESRMGFRYFDINNEIFWSNDEAMDCKLEEVVENLREELYQFEMRMREKINGNNLLVHDENFDFSYRNIEKPRRKSSFTSWSDSSKNSFLSSGEDFDMNISSPTLSLFTDSEYEKSSQIYSD